MDWIGLDESCEHQDLLELGLE